MDLFNRSWFGKEPEFPSGELNSTQTKVIAAWIAQLPKANLQVCADLLARGLEFLQNQLTALDAPATESKQLETAEEYFTNFELMRPLINYMSDQLRQQYFDDITSSPKNKRKIIAVAQVLQMILTKTYYTLAVHPMTYRYPTLRAQCIQRGIRHLTQIIVHNYKIYYPAPKECWLMLYDLYQQAEVNHLEQIPVRDDASPERMPMTVSNAFKVPLLLATCNPFQLDAADIENLLICIEHWTIQVTIHKEPTANDLYVTRLDKDEPPQFAQLAKATEGIPALRGIDTSALASHISAILSGIDQQNSSIIPLHGVELSSSVMRHLGLIWRQMPTRAFPRKNLDLDGKLVGLHTVVGMSAIHYFLNDRQSRISKCQTSERPDEERLPPQQTERDKKNAIQDFVFQIDPSMPKPTSLQESDAIQSPKYEMQTWKLVNSSSSGYCLCTTDDYPKAIHPGELVAIQEKAGSNESYWHVGIVRWIKHQSDGQVHIGLQLVAPYAVAVGIQNQRQLLQDHSPLPALYLPKIDAYHQPQSLITPSMPYQVGNQARIANRYIDTDVVLVRELESNRTYKRFEFTIQQHFGKSFDGLET